jgi:hypothetical protein
MELMKMKDEMKRWITSLALLGLILWVPAMVGCGGGRPDPRANPEFQEENLDPTKVTLPDFSKPPAPGATP